MANAGQAIEAVRDSVCAVMRVTRKEVRAKKNRPAGVRFGLGFVGTAWCVSADRYLVTAHHVLNGGHPRDPNDRFHVFTVPGNGSGAYHFPVIGYPVEDAASDLAILEIGPPTASQEHVPAVFVTLNRPPDGMGVLTYGFPAPAISGGNLNDAGDWLGGGQFFLKSHANEGIVSAQYELDGLWHFEFNVGWHHGESGGPVFQHEPVAAFAVMQHYRNIQAPHGVVAGPHRGRSLAAIWDELTRCGATMV